MERLRTPVSTHPTRNPAWRPMCRSALAAAFAIGQSVRVSSFWDREAATFDDEVDHGLSDPLVREAWRRLLRSLLPDSPADVADIGCGTGSLSVLLATDGYRVVGIDVSDKMLRVASRKAEAAQVTLGLLRGDAARPPLDRSSMDVVLVRHVCWALQRPEAAVKRWATLLRERGRLV